MIHLISDLHMDHDSDQGTTFLSSTFSEDRSEHTLIVAGDWGTVYDPALTKRFFDAACRRYGQVVAVPGNHEYWEISHTKTGAEAMNQVYAEIEKDYPNLFLVTKPERLELPGVPPVVAGTMWYGIPQPPTPHHFSDFSFMDSVTGPVQDWIFSQHDQFVNLLPSVQPGDIVVTHHMPSTLSSDPEYLNSPYNHYFVSPMEAEILALEPALWLHGHGHSPADYKIGKTTILCNPRGYPRERTGAYEPLVVIG